MAAEGTNGAKAFGSVMAVLTVIGVSIGALIAVTKPMALQIKSLEKRLETTEKRTQTIDDHRTQVVAINAAQWERIRSLERIVFGKPSSVEHGAVNGATP
jgi:uncharacterized membrane-anchored protein YhcB (DUF1043 family)